MPTNIGDFKVLKEIGKGGFGTVYRVQNVVGRTSALKVINSDIENPINEARIQAKLQNPNIVEVYDYHPDITAIEMEYVPRGSLADLLKKRPIPYERSMQIVMDVLQALEYAHEQGIMHCDVKPSNILFTEQGKAKLSDFGLAKLVEKEINSLPQEIKDSLLINSLDLTESGRITYSRKVHEALSTTKIKGTLPYMAPEQKEGRPSQQSDLYSIGLIFYEMLMGQLPSNVFPLLPSELNKECSKKIDEICKKALSPIEKRYSEAKEMLEDFKNVFLPEYSSEEKQIDEILKKKTLLSKTIDFIAGIPKKSIKYCGIGLGIGAGIAALSGLGYGGYHLIKSVPNEYLYSSLIGGITGSISHPAFQKHYKQFDNFSGFIGHSIFGAITGALCAPLIYGIYKIGIFSFVRQQSEHLRTLFDLINLLIPSVGGGAIGPTLTSAYLEHISKSIEK